MKVCDFTPLLSFYSLKHPVEWRTIFQHNAPLDVEIGFGQGEFLVRLAQENKGRNIVGLEQSWEGIYKALRRRTLINETASLENRIKNIRIIRFDARFVFEKSFEPKSIDRIYCLFPCPWPKKRHVKHRLFSKDFLKFVNSRLKDSGEIKIVTDFGPYHTWILEQIPQTGFSVKVNKISPQFDTKYERKWQRAGAKSFFEIHLRKENHIEILLEEGIGMKSFKLSKFDPGKFRFDNKTGEVAVILKEMLYDPKKEKMMLRFIVSEQNLIQPFWVVIMKKQNAWRICKADGQTFFPTPGINYALELVHASAQKSME